MFAEILGIIFKAVYWVLVPAALLRCYMQFVRVSFRNPVGQFICAVTDWLVLPIRRLVKAGGRVDWASLIAACIVELGLSAIYSMITGRWGLFSSGASVAAWLVNGLFGLAISILTMMMWLVFASALMSWVRSENPVSDVLDAITVPWLKPIRRRMPMVGGFDLSPLVLIVVLQIGLVALTHGMSYVVFAMK